MSHALPSTRDDVRITATMLTARLPGIFNPGIIRSCRFIVQTPLRLICCLSTQLSRVMSTFTMPRACSGPESYRLI